MELKRINGVIAIEHRDNSFFLLYKLYYPLMLYRCYVDVMLLLC